MESHRRSPYEIQMQLYVPHPYASTWQSTLSAKHGRTAGLSETGGVGGRWSQGSRLEKPVGRKKVPSLFLGSLRLRTPAFFPWHQEMEEQFPCELIVSPWLIQTFPDSACKVKNPPLINATATVLMNSPGLSREQKTNLIHGEP